MKKIDNKGFTLVEVLAVIVIIAVIGMIAVPNVLTSINRSKEASFDILVDDIKIGGQQMFEEIDNVGSILYHYNNTGKTINVIQKLPVQSDNPNETKTQIVVNLQTLVSNGFLVGTNREKDNTSNANSKVLLSPINNEDLGECIITITKTVDKSNNYKTSYSFENSSSGNPNCPINADYSS